MGKHHIHATVLQTNPLHVVVKKNKRAVNPAAALGHLRALYPDIPGHCWKIDKNRSAHRTLCIYQGDTDEGNHQEA